MKTTHETKRRAKIVNCAKCGMPQMAWTGNLGEGVSKDNQMFCCEGCANGRACICDSEITYVDFQGID